MSIASTVLIYEFYTGGGLPAGPLSHSLVSEAIGMLWALLTDFRRANVRTITALDARFEDRIPGLNRKTLHADEVVRVLPGDHKNIFLSLLRRCDAALITAPETNGILSELTSHAENAGKVLLSSSAAAAAVAGDKAACSRLFGRANLPNPKTSILSFDAVPEAAVEIDYPLIIKPVDGAGSEGVCAAADFSELLSILPIVKRATANEQVLLQSFSDGIPASVSLLTAKGKSLPLSLNCQLIEAGAPFQYRGSVAPFHHQEREIALDLAVRAVQLIPGLRGYVGVDLILKDEGVHLIEINPRLTTSYIGLRQISQTNLARAIWDAGTKGILPDPITLTGQVVIKKDNPATWGLSTG